ncbi:MAG: hypothetical protein Q9212_003900 [Teloschistes hypoglaucus]
MILTKEMATMQASPTFQPQYRSSAAAASDPVQRYIDVKTQKVAVLVSPGYGCYWSSYQYGKDIEIALFDCEIVKAVLDEDFEEAERLATAKLPCVLPEEVRSLVVVWVDQGDEFWISEDDGWEMLHLKKSFPFYQA